MSGGPNRFDPTGKAAPHSPYGTHELGDVHAVIHGGQLVLSSQQARNKYSTKSKSN